MFKNLNTDSNKKPRLLGELGDLSHAKVSSREFKYGKIEQGKPEVSPAFSFRTLDPEAATTSFVVWNDTHEQPETLKKHYAESPDWLRKLMDAFADGANFYLAKHPEAKPRVLHRFESARRMNPPTSA